MAEKRAGRKGVPALGWWLMLVGSLRLASVWFGFFDIWALRVAVFSQAESACPDILPPPLPSACLFLSVPRGSSLSIDPSGICGWIWSGRVEVG